MSININIVYTYVQTLIQKELGTGYLAPDAFNNTVNSIQIELFNKYADIFQERQQITDKLYPFIKRNVLIVNTTTGRMAYPSDYVDKVAVRAFEPTALEVATKECDDDEPINYHEIPQIDVDVLDNSMLGNRLVSTVIPPTKEYPIATFYDTYLQFYPIDIGSCVFEYLRQPVTAVWAYTVGANGIEIYDSANSVDIEFPYKMTNEFIVKVAQYFGISIREADLVQATQILEKNQA